MQSTIPAAKQPQQTYSWVYPSLAVLAALLIGWSGFWFFKTRQAASALAGWMQRESELGRLWSCPGEKIGGFPFSMEISCANPLFQGELFGKKLTGSVRALHATSPLLSTGDVIVQLDPPLAAKSSDGTIDLTAQWGQLIVEFELLEKTFNRVSISSAQLRLTSKGGPPETSAASFDDFNSYCVLSPDRHDRAYDFMVSFNQGSVPPLNRFLDTHLPVGMHVEGTVSQVNPGGAATLQEAIEKWRTDNGRVEIGTAWLTSGSMIFDAKGNLGLDSARRIDGKLDASFGGLEKAFSHMGLDPGLLKAGQVMAGVLSHGTDRVSLPVTFADGNVAIGGFPTNLQIPPLY